MNTTINVPQEPKRNLASSPSKPVVQRSQHVLLGIDQLRNERSPADLEQEEANQQQPSGWTAKM
jgi:hypothetical protein